MASNLQHQNVDPIHDTSSASRYTGKDPRTMENDRVMGKGPNYLKIGHLVRYRQSALDKYLAECEVKLGAAS